MWFENFVKVICVVMIVMAGLGIAQEEIKFDMFHNGFCENVNSLSVTGGSENDSNAVTITASVGPTGNSAVDWTPYGEADTYPDMRFNFTDTTDFDDILDMENDTLYFKMLVPPSLDNKMYYICFNDYPAQQMYNLFVSGTDSNWISYKLPLSEFSQGAEEVFNSKKVYNFRLCIALNTSLNSHIYIDDVAISDCEPVWEGSAVEKETKKTSAQLYSLNQNYPNPFNASTMISYTLSEPCQVTVKVYNMIGNEIATLVDNLQTEGYHCLKFNAGELSVGIYFYRITAGDFTEVKKMLFLK